MNLPSEPDGNWRWRLKPGLLNGEMAAKLALLAKAGLVSLFEGIQIYVTILAYGAGVDYCLFLTARYREELRRRVQARLRRI